MPRVNFFNTDDFRTGRTGLENLFVFKYHLKSLIVYKKKNTNS